MGMITLTEYAKRLGRTPSAIRHKILRGGVKTAQKIGRDWFIDENEPYIDERIKTGKYINPEKTKATTLTLLQNDNTD